MKYWMGPQESLPPTRADGEIAVEKSHIIETVSNRIYFYSGIDTSAVLHLVKALRDMDSSHITDKIQRNLKELPPIFLNVNSYGGSVHAGMSAADNILALKSPITSIVDGVCASAGTFITIVCPHRQITGHSMMMIHQLSNVFWGKYQEFQDQQKNLDMIMGMIKSIYLKYTKVPSEKIDEILKHDIYFTASQCLELGLVDEII